MITTANGPLECATCECKIKIGDVIKIYYNLVLCVDCKDDGDQLALTCTLLSDALDRRDKQS